MAQGLINNGINVTKSFSPNQLELLKDYTVSGSAITSYTFSGLKLNADEEIVLEILGIGGGVASGLFMYVNGNSTVASYYNQSLSANNTTVAGGRSNNSSIQAFPSTSSSFSSNYIKLTNNGLFVYQSNMSYLIGTSSFEMDLYYGTSTFALSQINSITLTSTQVNGIGIGSRFQLYKVKGQVVQTWATT